MINLTQHTATPEQIAAGVREPDAHKATIVAALNFDDIPTKADILDRAAKLAKYAEYELLQPTEDYEEWELPPEPAAMIGGAPYLMSALEDALIARGIKTFYAFSRRESVEETLPDGSIKKTAIFRHIGFVEAVA